MTENIANELRTAQAKVERILELNEAARDSDKVLYIEFMRRYTRLGMSMFFSLADIADIMQDMPSFEAISRARRKIQEQGRWVGTRREERADEAEGVKEWALNG